MTAPPLGDPRDRLAQETAEYIAAVLTTRQTPEKHPEGYEEPEEPHAPTSVEEIKATLLNGRLWVSWLDDRVIEAMRELHGEAICRSVITD